MSPEENRGQQAGQKGCKQRLHSLPINRVGTAGNKNSALCA
jgi:hypothetical protein